MHGDRDEFWVAPRLLVEGNVLRGRERYSDDIRTMPLNAHEAMDVCLTSIAVLINTGGVLKEATLLSELPDIPRIA
jgi:hypothetical protein